MKKIFRIMFNKVTIVLLLLLVQLTFIVTTILYITQSAIYLYIGLQLLSLVVIVHVVSKNDNPSYKLVWAVAILLFPLFGGLFYLLLGRSHLSKRNRAKLDEYRQFAGLMGEQSEGAWEALHQIEPSLSLQSRFIDQTGDYRLFRGTQTRFYPFTEEIFPVMLDEIAKAERFILLEYFIIQPGVMWDSVLAVLERKAAEGVEVLLMYDGFGSLTTVPGNFDKQLRAKGIQCTEFSPLVAWLDMTMNNRDHRKICVVDGNVGFCGGYNLADEYINVVEKYGHWKDTGIMLKGDGVWNLTLMFFQLWRYCNTTHADISAYRPTRRYPDDGFVQPFSDSPLDSVQVSQNTFLQAINRANRYIYITSPYLIIDNELITSLCIAARSGVDVRIVVPHIGDKWYVHMLTQSFYQQLVDNGVKIYEYTPGFIHAKMFVSDDHVAMVGTINMDYRSFYLHHECGVMLYHNSQVANIREDIQRTIGISEEITTDFYAKKPVFKRLLAAVLRLLAPMF